MSDAVMYEIMLVCFISIKYYQCFLMFPEFWSKPNFVPRFMRNEFNLMEFYKWTKLKN